MRFARGVALSLLAMASTGCSAAPVAPVAPSVAQAAAAPSVDTRVVFPTSVQQGSLVLGKVPANATVRYGARVLRPTNYGTVVFGIGRDATGPVSVDVTTADGRTQTARIAVTPRDWPVENVRGVPPGAAMSMPEWAAPGSPL